MIKAIFLLRRKTGITHEQLGDHHETKTAIGESMAFIDSGAIGRVTHIHWTFFNAFSRNPLRKHGWQFDRTMGGGWIRINSTHMIDALRRLVGEIVEVDARARIDVAERPDADGHLHPSTAEDGFSAFMTLDNGAGVVIETAWAVPGTMPDH